MGRSLVWRCQCCDAWQDCTTTYHSCSSCKRCVTSRLTPSIISHFIIQSSHYPLRQTTLPHRAACRRCPATTRPIKQQDKCSTSACEPDSHCIIATFRVASAAPPNRCNVLVRYRSTRTKAHRLISKESHFRSLFLPSLYNRNIMQLYCCNETLKSSHSLAAAQKCHT